MTQPARPDDRPAGLPEVDPRRTVPLTRMNDPWPESGYSTPGAAYADVNNTYKDHLVFACPGCGRVGSIRATHPKDAGGPSWDIRAGTLAEPETLSLYPSINCVGCCGWHGWLTAGTFTLEAPPS